ncbi:putative sulfate exporter family transporter [Streptomyces sp. NPDC050388]|uniref:YeiH family protein n=1 Tax=Streptomyces sp. NPDC050388 TaxID=3155781 RepID=UPI003413EE01
MMNPGGTTATSPASAAHRLLPGLTCVVAGTGAAYAVALLLPGLSALTAAVVLGACVGNLPVLPAAMRPGLQWATRRLLRAGVVLLGLQLAVEHVLDLGTGPVLAVALTVAISFLGTLGLGRLLGVSRGLAVLVATGFSICGASAIAAMESVVRREDEDVATAIALVTVYGGLAIVAVPLCGPLLGLTGVEQGAWAGLSVHEVAQVVAAASPAGAAAVATAAVVKLSRVVVLAPMVAGVSLAERRNAPPRRDRRPPLVPLFVLGFLAMVAVRTLGVLPEPVLDASRTVTTLLLAGALFGLGCSVRIGALLRTGPRALLLGLLSTLLVGLTAFAMLRLLG